MAHNYFCEALFKNNCIFNDFHIKKKESPPVFGGIFVYSTLLDL
jgi:hypothetical protein